MFADELGSQVLSMVLQAIQCQPDKRLCKQAMRRTQVYEYLADLLILLILLLAGSGKPPCCMRQSGIRVRRFRSARPMGALQSATTATHTGEGTVRGDATSMYRTCMRSAVRYALHRLAVLETRSDHVAITYDSF